MKCEFCSFESENKYWFKEMDFVHSKEPIVLCGLCQRSESALWYREGAGTSTSDRDLLLMTNVLLEAINGLREEIRHFQ